MQMEKRLTILRDSSFLKVTILISTIVCIVLKGILILCSLNLANPDHNSDDINNQAKSNFLFKKST